MDAKYYHVRSDETYKLRYISTFYVKISPTTIYVNLLNSQLAIFIMQSNLK